MTLRTITIVVLALILAAAAPGRAATAQAGDAFAEAGERIQRDLQQSLVELDRLRQRIAEEQVPLNRELAELESELLATRREFEQAARRLDRRTLDLSSLQSEIQARRAEAEYLGTLLGEYIRNLEARMHISELQRYRGPLEQTRLAMDNSSLPREEVFAAQAAMLGVSVDRIEDALGGVRFPGTAVAPDGMIRTGEFLLMGPYALFSSPGRSTDEPVTGVAEQRIGSLEPTIMAFGDPADAAAAAELVADGRGVIPFDPTLGNAIKVEATEETLWEHMQKGGPVMVPILALAALSLAVALFKWISFFFVRAPSSRRLRGFLEAVSSRDRGAAMEQARRIGGPTGLMLARGVEHMQAPRELVEEIMYETVLTTRLKLQRALPFIAICAAAAPLLGLLGTVTGIINTFKLITVFGSGDVKTLSGGISEALVTTEFGLITAIPALLMHAFLSRRARGVVDGMEKAAVSFVNELGKSAHGAGPAGSSGAPVPAPAAPTPDVPAPPSEPARPEVSTTPRPSAPPAAVPAGAGWNASPGGPS